MDNELGSSLRALPRVLLYVAITLPACLVQSLALAFHMPLMNSFPRRYHHFCMRILGIQVVITGKRSKTRPTLFVANHSSYLDIPVLGSILVASFVAKAEIASWPFFGMLAKLQRTIFIDRKPTHAAVHSNNMRNRLGQQDNLILFPEGTSSDGNRTLPFKTALFSVTDLRTTGKDGVERPLTVQPVSITCVALDGMPTGRFLRPIYSWYGDMPLVPHLWRMLALGRITVAVHFHEPVDVVQLGSRKAVAEHCWQAVSNGVSDAVSGNFQKRGRRRPLLRRTGAKLPQTGVSDAA